MTKRYDYVLPTHPVDYGLTLPISTLQVDPQAQRTLNERRAQQIADAMVPEAIGSIIVSERGDGTRFIVDGFHRKRACELNGITDMICEVHYDLTQQEEAILFLIKNRESNKPSAFDEYRVGLTAQLPLFVDTEKVIVAHGLQMGSSSTNTIGAVAGVLRITENYGPDVLDRVFDVAEDAWGRTAASWDGMLLGGIGMFLGKHGHMVTNDHELAMKLAKVAHAEAWIGRVHARSTSGGTTASGTGGRISACYAIIVETWNRGRRTNKIVL